MSKTVSLALAGLVLWCAGVVNGADGNRLEPVSDREAAAWVRHLVPWPKQLAFSHKAVVQPGEVLVTARAQASPLVAQAVLELRQCLGNTNQIKSAKTDRLEIVLQLGGKEAAPLRALKNAGQAYRIVPEPEPGPGRKRLLLAALEPRGLYYASKTLQQFIRARASPAQVEIPWVTITDWPDMEDRGLWGSDTHEWLPWLAERKINLIEHIAAPGVDPQTRRATATIKPGREPLLDVAPRVGIQHVPVLLHLEQLSGKGIFEAYPELPAQGGREGAICYSQPAIVPVLADWIAALGSLPGVEEVDVWLTENLGGAGGCRCQECQKTDRSLLETRTVLAAWEKARAKSGRPGLRILTSEETYRSNALIFGELPAGVKLWYYHSLLTYNASANSMITGDVLKLAVRGHWTGVCPSLVAHVGFPQPFTGAAFVHHRLREFTDKRLAGLLGYATPGMRYARFNVEAAAEWAWNAHGRSPREFAVAWAARERIADPEKLAEWVETIGPVSWRVYGSEWPAGQIRRALTPVAKALREGTVPELGTVKHGVFRAPWGEFKSVGQLDKDLELAQKALALARELKAPEFIQESLVIQGYIRSLKALWELKALVKDRRLAPEHRPAARGHFRDYVGALQQAAAALAEWEKTVADTNGTSPRKAVEKPVALLQNMVQEMKDTAAALGVQLEEKAREE